MEDFDRACAYLYFAPVSRAQAVAEVLLAKMKQLKLGIGRRRPKWEVPKESRTGNLANLTRWIQSLPDACGDADRGQLRVLYSILEKRKLLS